MVTTDRVSSSEFIEWDFERGGELTIKSDYFSNGDYYKMLGGGG